jgi:hypothetical protein
MRFFKAASRTGNPFAEGRRFDFALAENGLDLPHGCLELRDLLGIQVFRSRELAMNDIEGFA